MSTARVASARAEILLPSVREPIFVIGPDRRMHQVNRAWEEFTGRPANEVLGLECGKRAASLDDSAENLVAAISPPRSVLEGSPLETKALIVKPGSERTWVRLTFQPLRSTAASLNSVYILGFIGPIAEPAGISPDPLRLQLLAARHDAAQRYGIDSLVGRSPAHLRLLEQIRLAASTTNPVSIRGPRGSGKKTVARVIHQLSRSRHLPFIPIDCSLLPSSTIERELFSDQGLVESSDPIAGRSTILLIEPHSLERETQRRIARRIDDHRRIMLSSNIASVDSSDVDLDEEFACRFSVLTIEIAPLSSREADIPLMAQHLLDRMERRLDGNGSEFAPGVLDAMRIHDWPGGVSELARVVEFGRDHASTHIITMEDLPPPLRPGSDSREQAPSIPRQDLDSVMTRVERRLIELALQRAAQNKSRAAELLGISRPRLYRRIRELEIPDLELPESS
ncbi:MAG: sigma 54-interacting transcriptional regulator [Isosphaeraceae bacterium]|nr:sigma 54-interacting transcriptional regulator [Isosphaeraceae bacterium]